MLTFSFYTLKAISLLPGLKHPNRIKKMVPIKWAKLPCPEYKPNKVKVGLLAPGKGATVPSSQATPHFLYTGCTQPKVHWLLKYEGPSSASLPGVGDG